MMYLNKKTNELINLSLVELVSIHQIESRWVVYARRVDTSGFINTPAIASFDTEQEAIAELEYIAKEMNK